MADLYRGRSEQATLVELLEAEHEAVVEFVYAHETDPGWPQARYDVMVIAMTRVAQFKAKR